MLTPSRNAIFETLWKPMVPREGNQRVPCFKESDQALCFSRGRVECRCQRYDGYIVPAGLRFSIAAARKILLQVMVSTNKHGDLGGEALCQLVQP